MANVFSQKLLSSNSMCAKFDASFWKWKSLMIYLQLSAWLVEFNGNPA